MKIPDKVYDAIDSDESGFKALPPDDYPVIVRTIEHHESKAGNTGWKVTLQIPEGEGEEHAGRQFFTYLTFTEAASFKVEEFEKAIGVERGTDSDEMIGRRCIARVGVVEYDGQDRNEVKRLIADPMAEAMAGEEPF